MQKVPNATLSLRHDSRPGAARVHLYNYNIIISPKLPNKLRTFFLLIIVKFLPHPLGQFKKFFILY